MIKQLLGFTTAILLLLIIGASRPISQEETPSVTVLSVTNPFVKVNTTKELMAPPYIDATKISHHVWSTDKGKLIENKGSKVVLEAPNTPGQVIVTCEEYQKKKLIATYQYILTTYNQIIVLKADDLVYESNTVFPANWIKFFDLVDSLNIKASAGIIGNSLENAPQAYYDKIKMYAKKGNIEFWNHGYSHLLKGTNAKGEIYHEHYNTDEASQKANFLRTQKLAKEKLGFTFRAFGAPGNAIDENTKKLIDESGDIWVWFYGDNSSRKSVLKRTPGSEIEYPVHHPHFDKFLQNYPASVEVLTLQLHPTLWDNHRMKEFRKILFYLYDQKVTFMNPSEYAKAFYPHLTKDPSLAIM